MFDRSLWVPAGTLFAAGLLVSSAGATPVTSVQFTDGEVLNVRAVVGSGANSTYLAVDFSDGASEAFEYKFNGTTDGYTVLTAIAGTVNGLPSGPTTLAETDTYYASFSEHFVDSLVDGTNRLESPGLYFSPPDPNDATNPYVSYGTSAQGVYYEDAPYGIDDVVVGNGTIIGFDVGADVPVLPEVAVPEPVSAAALGVLSLATLLKRRR